MKEWQLKEAKTQFSKVVSEALKGEEQVILENGKKTVVVLSYDKYLKLVQGERTLYDIFSTAPEIDLAIERDKTPIKPFELE